MSTTTNISQTASIVFSESLNTLPLTSVQHNNTLDDYFRLISSQTGKYLASITNGRRLDMIDVYDQAIFANFTLENCTYVAFSER